MDPDQYGALAQAPHEAFHLLAQGREGTIGSEDDSAEFTPEMHREFASVLTMLLTGKMGQCGRWNGWRRAWREGGMEALRSAGPANSPTVTDTQFAVLEEELGKGPSGHGFDDQRWTLARVQTVIRRRLRLSLSVATVWRLLRRHGWSWQAPARRALERDEHAVELWKKEVWPQVKASRRRVGAGSSSRTRPDSP